VPAAKLDRTTVRLLALAWVLTGIGAAALVVGYAEVPDSVPLYRQPWGDAPIVGAKSIVTVGRFVTMGVGQVGASTAMAFAAAGTESWERLWRWAALTAGAKTLFECAALLATPASPIETLLLVLTGAVVTLFLGCVTRWWWKGALRSPPRVPFLHGLGVLASLAVWAGSAIAPRFTL